MKNTRCSECNKEYDSKLDVCPHCGYENQILKHKNIIKLVLIVISVFLFIISIKSIFNGISTFEMENYFEKYGSEQSGTVAYYLDRIRAWSMSICILGIWIGMYIKNKNVGLSKVIEIIFIILFVLFQILPLGYAIYIKALPEEAFNNNTIDVENYTSEYCYENGCNNKRMENSIYCNLHHLYPIKEE